MAMNSTPRSRERIMRLTALLPPPPTPTTLIRALPSRVRSISCGATSSLSRSSRARKKRSAGGRDPGPFVRSGSSMFNDSLPLEEIAQPADRALIGGAHPGRCRDMAVGAVLFQPPAEKADGGGVRRARDLLAHPRHAGGRAHSHRQIEQGLGGVEHSHEAGSAAGEHDSGREEAVDAAAADLEANHLEELLDSRGDDLGEGAAGNRLDSILAHLVKLDHLFAGDAGGHRVPAIC